MKCRLIILEMLRNSFYLNSIEYGQLTFVLINRGGEIATPINGVNK
jgi:hypothetical protein